MNLIREAIFGGHYWALEWEMTGVLHTHSDDRKVVRQVVDILDMWGFIERGYEALSEQDKARVREGAEMIGETAPSFHGFDGNNETEHMGIARFLIEKMNRFQDFHERYLNSHSPTVRRYLRMYRGFETIRPNLVGRQMNVDELIAVLRRERFEDVEELKATQG